MASLRAKPGSGLLFFDYRHQGVRYRHPTTMLDTPENRSKLALPLARLEAAIRNGTLEPAEFFAQVAPLDSILPVEPYVPTPPTPPEPTSRSISLPTFGEFTRIWLAEIAPTWRAATREQVHSLLTQYLLPVLDHRPLNEITRPELLQFRAELISTKRSRRQTPLSPASVNHVLKLMRAILAEAAGRYEFQDPAARVKQVKNPRKDIHPFSLAEVTRILESCRTDYRNYFTVRFFTGMRTGEIHGLKWSHLDFERRQILIRETFHHGRTEYTKNDGSQREIDMSSAVYEALKRQHAATGHQTYVFCTASGQPLAEGNVTKRVWYPLLNLLDLERRRPYQTRHTCATLWLAAGESPEWIARQLGHTTTDMLFRHYSRYVPNLTRRDGSAIERLLAESLGKMTWTSTSTA